MKQCVHRQQSHPRVCNVKQGKLRQCFAAGSKRKTHSWLIYKKSFSCNITDSNLRVFIEVFKWEHFHPFPPNYLLVTDVSDHSGSNHCKNALIFWKTDGKELVVRVVVRAVVWNCLYMTNRRSLQPGFLDEPLIISPIQRAPSRHPAAHLLKLNFTIILQLCSLTVSSWRRVLQFTWHFVWTPLSLDSLSVLLSA